MFTPGPYRRDGRAVVTRQGSRTVAVAGSEIDAALFATAPEMYEVLVDLRSRVMEMRSADPKERYALGDGLADDNKLVSDLDALVRRALGTEPG